MIIRTSLRTCIILLICAYAKPRGYADLDTLYKDFVVVLRSSDNARLKEFCQKISPDEETAVYMKKVGLSHRGFPEKYDGGSAIEDMNYQIFYAFRERLKASGVLGKLQFVKMKDGEHMLMETFNISATETEIILQSGDKKITGKLGEMLKLNGTWKTFTKPYFHYIE